MMMRKTQHLHEPKNTLCHALRQTILDQRDPRSMGVHPIATSPFCDEDLWLEPIVPPDIKPLTKLLFSQQTGCEAQLLPPRARTFKGLQVRPMGTLRPWRGTAIPDSIFATEGSLDYNQREL